MKIIIVQLTPIPKDVLDRLCDFLNKCLKSECIPLPEHSSPPLSAYNFSRGQYDSFKVLKWLSKTYSLEGVDYIVGLGDVDAYVEGLNFVFGTADYTSKTCIVYLKRLKIECEFTSEKFLERLVKEVLHELGHLLGLQHCLNPKCVMRFSNSLEEVDLKTWRFCRNCAKILSEKNILVNCVLE